jgi:hypothetical protein
MCAVAENRNAGCLQGCDGEVGCELDQWLDQHLTEWNGEHQEQQGKGERRGDGRSEHG